MSPDTLLVVGMAFKEEAVRMPGGVSKDVLHGMGRALVNAAHNADNPEGSPLALRFKNLKSVLLNPEGKTREDLLHLIIEALGDRP